MMSREGIHTHIPGGVAEMSSATAASITSSTGMGSGSITAEGERRVTLKENIQFV